MSTTSWDIQRQEGTLLVVQVSGYKTQKEKTDDNRVVGLFGI
jgi:hypothetical protein